MSKTVEEWRPIKDYEGLYEVSDWGNVRRLCKNKTKPIAKEEIKGYLRVHLWKNGVGKHIFIHKLVAQAFIPNPENKPCIGHKKPLPDGTEDKTANEVWNIEWMTYKENANYGTLSQRRSEAQLNDIKKSTPINVYKYPSMEFIGTFPSQKEVERLFCLYNINKVLKGVYKQDKGYTFDYA